MKLFLPICFCWVSWSMAQTEPASTMEVPDQIQVLTKSDTSLLKKPRKKSKSRMTIPAGVTLTATDANGLFLKVEHEGKKGWIHVSQLRFDQYGKPFVEARNQARTSYAQKRRGGGSKSPLQQCAHVHSNGQQCMYKTADDSGKCPEHQ